MRVKADIYIRGLAVARALVWFRWFVIVAVLLGIQGDVAILQHGPGGHDFWTALSLGAWLGAAWNIIAAASPTAEREREP